MSGKESGKILTEGHMRYTTSLLPYGTIFDFLRNNVYATLKKIII